MPLATTLSTAIAPEPAVPSVARFLLAITFAKLSLRVLGFGRTLRLTTRSAERPILHPHVSPEFLALTAEHVATAGAVFPGRALCLEQSLSLYFVLRRQGVEAQLRLGVRPLPFAAHAWVEHAGEPVNEQRDFIKQLATFEERLA